MNEYNTAGVFQISILIDRVKGKNGAQALEEVKKKIKSILDYPIDVTCDWVEPITFEAKPCTPIAEISNVLIGYNIKNIEIGEPKWVCGGEPIKGANHIDVYSIKITEHRYLYYMVTDGQIYFPIWEDSLKLRFESNDERQYTIENVLHTFWCDDLKHNYCIFNNDGDLIAVRYQNTNTVLFDRIHTIAKMPFIPLMRMESSLATTLTMISATNPREKYVFHYDDAHATSPSSIDKVERMLIE